MNIVIIGASGGIGNAFIEQLIMHTDVAQIHATYYHTKPLLNNAKVVWSQLDITNEQSIQQWTSTLGEIDWLINAAGLLHTAEHGPEKTIGQFDVDFFIDNIRINTLASMLLAKHTVRNFKHRRPAIFATLSARVGSIEDNYLGGWISYRASKAALNMCLKTLAIEWRRSLPNVTVAALHPGTTDTPLSKPFQRFVPEGQLHSPEQSVISMLNVLHSLRPNDSGCFRAFDGEQLPW